MKDFFSQAVTRREFLMRVGVMLIGLTGIPSFLKLIGAENASANASTQPQQGFGDGPYGGEKV